jgi:hypothetical protein
MLIVLEFDEKLHEKLNKNIGDYTGRVIDISEIPSSYSSNLNISLAKLFGVTQEELSVQVLEDHIRKLAQKANIEVVCLDKQQAQKEQELVETFRPGRIILLK